MSADIVLENENLRVSFDGAGRIKSLIDKRRGIDFFEQKSKFMGRFKAGVRVRDELKYRDYCEIWEKPRIVNLEKSGDGVIFKKTFMGADFDIEEEFTLKKDHLYWQIRLYKTRGEDRTVQIRYMLPFLEFWNLWAPCDGTPILLDGMKSFRFNYPFGSRMNQDNRIAIPMVTIYNSRLDSGLSLVEPFELPKPGVSFLYESSETDMHYGIRPTVYYEEPRRMPYLQVANLNLRLAEDGRAWIALMLVPHDGDWRPGLGWLYNRYREYFDPGLREAWDHVGIWMSGFQPTKETEDVVKKISKYGRILWEIHGFFPFYGLFVPDKEPWESRAHTPGVMVTYDTIRKMVRMLHKYGAHAYLYWEIREGLKDWVLENFSDSLVKTEKGELVPAYWGDRPSEEGGTYLLNPDLHYSWGKHCLEQAKKELEMYPEIDGIFVDGYREMEYDFGHDDNITMVHNKPAYYWNFAYFPVMEKISELCHSQKKGLFANKPVTVESQKYLDILMIEASDPPYLVNIAYMGLNKPLSWISWFRQDQYDLSKKEGCLEYLRDLEDRLKLCMKWGAFPQFPILQRYVLSAQRQVKVWERGLDLEDNLYSAYMRLIEMLRGRRWIFQKRPVKFSYGLDGNIFESPNGEILVPVISGSSFFEEEGVSGLYVQISIPGITEGTSAEIFLLDKEEPIKLTIEDTVDPWMGVIKLPKIKGAAMIKIPNS